MTEQSRQGETIQPIAEARGLIRPDVPGALSFEGRVWSAISLQSNIPAGTRVVVIGKKDSTLIVESISRLELHQLNKTELKESSSISLDEMDSAQSMQGILIDSIYGSIRDNDAESGDDWISLDSIVAPLSTIRLDHNAEHMHNPKDRPRKPSRYSQGRGERIITFSSGGAFLGGMIAQIPGAVIGALLAVIFAAIYKPRRVKEHGS